MPDYVQIYAQRATDYDALVSREDYQHHLLPAIQKICPLAGIEVVEMGAGTGRVTRLLAPHVKSIRAFDASQHMLDTAAERLKQDGITNVVLQAADSRALPAESASADLSIAGWTFSHSLALFPDTWRDEIGKMISELLRVVRPGGTAIIIETLGTGFETPTPPREVFVTYYDWFEAQGFTRDWIRTDYQFDSLEESERLIRFFFGDALGDKVLENHWVIVPECTGLWWKKQ